MITQIRYMAADILEDVGSRIQASAIADIDAAIDCDRATIAAEWSLFTLELGHFLNTLANTIAPAGGPR